MRLIVSAVCVCLIVFAFTGAIRAQDKLTTLAAVKANSPATAALPESSLYSKGLALLTSGQYAEAVNALRQVVEQNPNDAAAYGKLGLAYAALGQYKEAVVVLKMAIRIKPDIVESEEYYQLSMAYTALGKFPQALEAIKQALYTKRAERAYPENGNASKFPSMADLHYTTGLAYYNLRMYPGAIEELKQAISLNPKHAAAYFGLAITYLTIGDRKSAEKQQPILESLDPVYAAQLAKLLSTKPNDQPPTINPCVLTPSRCRFPA
jgi:tetratricopeptide (TPR) repeat protein